MSNCTIDSGAVYGTILSMMWHKCEILIPLLYGRSRKPVEPETLVEIISVFNRQFGGHTPLGETESPHGVGDGGNWVDPDTGEVVADKCWLVRVYVPPAKLAEFEAVAYAIGHRLEQKEMLIDIGPQSGKFLKMFDAEDELAETENDDQQKRSDYDERQGGNAGTASG